MSTPAGIWLRGRLEIEEAPRAGLIVVAAAADAVSAAWERWGDELAAHVDTTFLVWDPDTRRGVLSRGRGGDTPLLIAPVPGGLAFAGDPGPLLARMPATPAPDTAGVAGWLARGAPPVGRTLWQGVRRLAPGTHLRFAGDGVTERTHWHPSFAEPISDRAEAEDALRAALTAAVRSAAGPHDALLLSGGLDSTTVAALSPQPPLALHAAFPLDGAVDETAVVDATAAALGLVGLRAVVHDVDPLAAAVRHSTRWRAPLTSPNDPVWDALAGAAAQRGTTALIDGEGGDSVLGPAPYVLADLLRGGRLRTARDQARALVGPDLVARGLWRFGAAGLIPERAHRSWRSLRPARPGPPWLLADARSALADAEEPWAFKRLDGPRWWAHRAHELLWRLDASGAHDAPRRRAAALGMTHRHPLLDPAVIELALRLDPLLLHDGARDRPLARDALRGIVPSHVLDRTQKASFNAVQERWLDAVAGPVRELLGRGALVGAYADLGAVAELVDGRRRTLRRPLDLWRLLSAEVWLRDMARGAGSIAGCQRLDRIEIREF
ncbi:MAG: asparagine synthase-related protein [Solirubrobacteraceae bacterium]